METHRIRYFPSACETLNFLRAAELCDIGVAKPCRAVQVRYMTEREDWVQAMVAVGPGSTLMPQFLPIIDGVLLRPVIEPEVSR